MKKIKQEQSYTLISISLLTISGAHLITHVLQSMHTALFPVFREEFNLTLQQLGFIAAIPPLCQVLSYVPSGIIADKFGQKTLMIISFVIAGISAIGLGLSSNIWILIFFLSILTTSITIYHPQPTA